jgi:uncharacterized membrane protein
MSMSKPTITQVFKSVLAAFVGVQSEANRKKDFEQGSLSAYIIAGLVFTVLFVAAIIFLVSTVLGS